MEDSMAQSDEAAAELDEGFQEHVHSKAVTKEGRWPLQQQAKYVCTCCLNQMHNSDALASDSQRCNAVNAATGSKLHATCNAC